MIKPKKSLGQNFLKNPKVVQDLVNAANITKNDTVLEIGAGIGVVTKEIAKQADRVIAVEFDRDLIPVLQENLKNFNNIQIVNQNILDFRFTDYQPKAPAFGRAGELRITKIVGSIPYQITSPLIHKLIQELRRGSQKHRSCGIVPAQPAKPFSGCCLRGAIGSRGYRNFGFGRVTPIVFRSSWPLAVLLIQKEVAQKITAQPPHATYLSNFIQTFTKVELVRTVPKTAFWPTPAVDGAIIKLTSRRQFTNFTNSHSEFWPKANQPLAEVPHDENIQDDKKTITPQKWSKFLHRGFAHPRKMLNKSFPKDVLEKAGIGPTQRPQELTVKDWRELYKQHPAKGKPVRSRN